MILMAAAVVVALPANDHKPICATPSRGRYVVFDMDHGGLTNVRLGLQYAAEIACHTGRTLVLPPAGAIWMKVC